MSSRQSPDYPGVRPQPPYAAELPATPVVRSFTSEELFAGRTEIGIVHEGALYRLKITRQGKLILNK